MNEKRLSYIFSARVILLLGAIFLFADQLHARRSNKNNAQPDQIEQEIKNPVYLGSYLKPWEHSDTTEPIEFLFENAELSTLLQYIEQKFNLIFILDDSISPLPQGSKSIMGSKISFKTHKPLSRKDAWNLFVTFLDMAGLTPVPGPGKNVYKLMPSADPKSPQAATRAPLPTFVGVDPSMVPNNDTRIRYVYFVENASIAVIKNVADSMKSVSAPNIMELPELNALIFTDKASNIRAMLDIIKELDQANMPEVLAVVKLKRADANKAAKLYDDLTKKEGQQGFAARLLGGRRPQTTEYFSEGTRIIPEPRTNRLILLGSRESVKKITDFLVNIVDQQDVLPDVPLYIYKLRFLDAESMANILQEASKFQMTTDAGKVGGVRDEDKFLKPLSITAEKTTNSLIINADYEDYSKIYQLLQKMDVEQPQVALKVFILSIDLTDQKAFGVQMRNKKPGVSGLIGKNTNFQTSGLAGAAPEPVVENPSGTGATRLLGDLVSLASGVNLGSTVVSLGADAFGVWGILNMLETHQAVNVVANPFLVTTHKYPAQFSIGESRYVLTATVFGSGTPQNTFGYVDANLTVNITPQISSDGLVLLDTKVIIEQFDVAAPTSTNGNRTLRKVETSVIVADNEVLALGGLIREATITDTSRVPILGSIPLIGWLFKNRTKNIVKNSLLILILPEIIRPPDREVADVFTRSKFFDAKYLAQKFHSKTDDRDPIHRWLFKDNEQEETQFMDTFSATQDRYTIESNLQLGKQHIQKEQDLTKKNRRSLTAAAPD